MLGERDQQGQRESGVDCDDLDAAGRPASARGHPHHPKLCTARVPIVSLCPRCQPACHRVPNANSKGNFTSSREGPQKPNVRTFWLISWLPTKKLMVWIYLFFFNVGRLYKAPSLLCDRKGRSRIHVRIWCKSTESISSRSRLILVSKILLLFILFRNEKNAHFVCLVVCVNISVIPLSQSYKINKPHKESNTCY